MIQQQKPGKQIVSKRDFAAKIAKKVALSSSGVSLYLLGLLGAAFFIVTLCLTRFLCSSPFDYAVIVGFLLISAGVFYVGRRMLSKGIRVETGIPITRANTADLTVPEILVRASQEPLSVQKAVLLRAAAATEEQHEEQLLRASAGTRK